MLDTGQITVLDDDRLQLEKISLTLAKIWQPNAKPPMEEAVRVQVKSLFTEDAVRG